ncbi:metallophosphoesterase family protein [bacterium]|nr:metallophosphoesterase family protein [bacterium]
MKIAIISDIHGNLDALTSVLENIEKEGCSKIFCLGDIAMAGPEPSLTIHKIQELIQTKDFYIIQGNTDKMLSVFSFDIQNAIMKVNAVMASAYFSDSQILTNEEKNFLAQLPEKQELTLFGVKILLVHGSPRRNDENIFPNMKIEEVEEIIKDTKSDVIFCGHTHMPCGYQTNTEQTVVNVGSVGRPFSETPLSCYAIMEIEEEIGTFEIKHNFVEYEVEKAAEKIRKRGFEGADKLAKMLLHATSRYPE